jgi:hypothetical protein
MIAASKPRENLLIMRRRPLNSQRAPALSDESTRKRDERTGDQNPKYFRQEHQNAKAGIRRFRYA